MNKPTQSITSLEQCHAVCVEKGMDRSFLVSSSSLDSSSPRRFVGRQNPQQPPQQHLTSHNNSKTETFMDWVTNHCEKSILCVTNYHSQKRPLDMYWSPHPQKNTTWKHMGTLYYGQEQHQCLDTVLGHQFQFVDSFSSPHTSLFNYTIHLSAASIPIGKPKHPLLLKQEQEEEKGSFPMTDPIVTNSYNYTNDIQLLVKNEWERHLNINYTFSEWGYQKGSLPLPLYIEMSTYYYNNQPSAIYENWYPHKGYFVNWYESLIYLVPIPWKLQHKWSHQLLPLVEQWINPNHCHSNTTTTTTTTVNPAQDTTTTNHNTNNTKEEYIHLEQTSMYGFRKYTEHSRIVTHIDKVDTHAVGCIINIAQGKFQNPWPLQIFDHSNRLHEVTMRPGEMVFYESSKCLHGRNQPLVSSSSSSKNAADPSSNKDEAEVYYVNLFTHYRPIDNPYWYKKTNPNSIPTGITTTTTTSLLSTRNKKKNNDHHEDDNCYCNTTATFTCSRSDSNGKEDGSCREDPPGPSEGGSSFFQPQNGEELFQYWNQYSND